MNFTPFVFVWLVIGIATAGLALYRKVLAMKEDDYIHIEDWRKPEVVQQEAMARRIHAIDRFGETLSVLTVIGGVALAVAYVYAQLAVR